MCVYVCECWNNVLFCLCKVKKDFILSALIIADNSTVYSKYYKQELVLLPVFCLVKQIQDKHEKTVDVSQRHHKMQKFHTIDVSLPSAFHWLRFA